ncbi:hypothetical protein CON20_26940 [Priestia megaterium]|nr:hypothetical protein CON20_26940 [Priestia megaterium]
MINFVLGMVGLAICPHLPKFEMQGEKSGDFLSDFLKKYYSNLVWRIALIFIDKSEKRREMVKNIDISVV